MSAEKQNPKRERGVITPLSDKPVADALGSDCTRNSALPKTTDEQSPSGPNCPDNSRQQR